MTSFKSLFSIESMTAVVTWLIVSLAGIWLMIGAESFAVWRVVTVSILLLVFIISFLLAIQEPAAAISHTRRILLMGLQYVAVLIIMLLMPFNFIAILIVMWSCQIPHYLSLRNSILLSPVWSLAIWLIPIFYWQQDFAVLSAVLYWTFNLFALVMISSTIREKTAREAANELNRELMATQALLSEATKQAERVRIARNIHDLLGHHLTALTINLQVAARISEGEAQSKIQQCHDLAKLLLSDVREAVSEIREKSNLQLIKALHALVDNIPEMQVKLEYSQELQISNVMLADTLLRCVQEGITNTLKHGNASKFHVQLNQRQQTIHLLLQDNGQGKAKFIPGNGIKGMQERVAELGGILNVNQTKQGFITMIELPESL